MSELVMQFITYLLKGIFLSEILNYGLELRKNKKQQILLLVIYVIGYYLIQAEDYKQYIYHHIYTIIVFYLYSKEGKYKKEIQVPMLFLYLSLYEIFSMLMNVLAVILIFVFPLDLTNTKGGMVILTSMGRVLVLYCGYKISKGINLKVESIVRYQHLIYIASILTLCVKIPFLYTSIRDVREWKVIILSICFCTTIFVIISQIERRNAAKEKARIEENNKLLSAKLHKSQEILPAMVQVLSDVTEKNGAEMEEHKAHKLLKEVSNLYCQQMKENEKEDLQLKNFCSTGLTLLDQQLKVYQSEAIEREYNLDIYVQAPINDLIKNTNIDQLRLQRAIGDLIRNAFCAVGKTDKKGGHILLIIGCQKDNILEVAVMDDGIEMPLQVLEAFGKRGITTGGTGNGLADIWEFAKETKASIQVDEFKEEDSFTKKISIIFNGQQIYCLNSSRKDDVKTFKWNN